MNWHSIQPEEAAKRQGSDLRQGLSESAVQERLREHGENVLAEKAPKTFLQRFLDQLKDVMILILLAAASVSAAISAYNSAVGGESEWIDSIVIVLIVVINGVLGVIQENRAEAALAALKQMTKSNARVLRDGREQVVPSSALVPGDILLLEAGDVVPADGRIFESASLKADESALTGESVPVDKSVDSVADDASLGDRTDMVYSGSSITYGRARVIVVNTGMNTEMGHIATLIGEEGESVTPLQQKLASLGKYLGIAALAICAVIFVIGILSGLPLMSMFMTAVSLAVAAIPEGLPAIVTVVLALGVRRMVGKHAIIRRLPAVETLGSTTVICSDKTGTLTENRMTLVSCFAGGIRESLDNSELSKDARDLIEKGALCSDGAVEQNEAGELKHIGDPTETSIVAALLKLGETKGQLEEKYPRVAEIPFDSDRKLMSVVNRHDGKLLVIVKGAPDILLSRCTSGDVEAAVAANEEMGREALRVLAVGCKEIDSLPAQVSPETVERDLRFVGLLGMIDPPRQEVFAAIEECHNAGIRTVMITGDHVATASAIAGQLGIIGEGEGAISGEELAAIGDDELDRRLEGIRVYARVSPSDKIRIVKAWQKRNQVVAMTGDGVNDAPALKASDIGCAMGITGTEVAKGAADMILTDDNFTTIVAAVREGRGIYDNIRKAVRFLLSCNLGEIVTVFLSMLIWRESPLLPIQILWVNLVTDSFPALALGVEEIESDIMSRRPRPKDESIFAGGVGVSVVLEGLMIGLLTLTAYFIGTRTGLPNAGIPLGETMAFAVLALSQLVHSSNVRSSLSIFKVGFFSNINMVKAVALSFVLVMAVLTIPFLQEVFQVIPMTAAEWAIVAALSVVPLFVCEAVKAFRQL